MSKNSSDFLLKAYTQRIKLKNNDGPIKQQATLTLILSWE